MRRRPETENPTPEDILASSSGEHHTPLTKICFDGMAREVSAVRIPDIARPDDPGEPALRVVSAPLEWMFYRAPKPIEVWQYQAGVLYRKQYHAAQISPARAVDMGAAALYATAEVMAAKGAGARANKRYGTDFTAADHRIDAVREIGHLMSRISNLSYFLLWRVVGEEYSLSRMAAVMGEDKRYLMGRFREALTEAAGYYRLATNDRPSRPAAVAPYRSFGAMGEDEAARATAGVAEPTRAAGR
jgi:hypothetical protein